MIATRDDGKKEKYTPGQELHGGFKSIEITYDDVNSPGKLAWLQHILMVRLIPQKNG